MGSTDVTQTNGTTTGDGTPIGRKNDGNLTNDLTPEQKADAGLMADLRGERQKRQALEQRLAKMEEDQQTASRVAAEEAGKYRELYEGLKPAHEAVTQKLTAYEKREADRVAALVTRNEARVAALPEDFRDLIPAGLDPDHAASQIEKLEARARKADPGFAKGGSAAGATKAPPGIPAECQAEAARNKRDPQWWFDNVWNDPKAIRRRAQQSKT